MTGPDTDDAGMQDNGRTRMLRPPREPLDARTVGWWRAHLLIWTATPVIVLGVLGLLIAPARVWLLGPAGVLLVLGLLSAAVLPRYWYLVHRWEVTDTAVYTRSGFLWQEWRAAPMSRIQTVDATRGPLQRAFGLSSVLVTTASAKGAVTITGLDHERAAALAERLTLVTEETPGDAT